MESVETHQHAKFCQNRSFLCGDIVIFADFQDGRRRHLGFLKSRNFICYWGPGWRRISMPNFVIIGKSVVKILTFFGFSKFYRLTVSPLWFKNIQWQYSSYVSCRPNFILNKIGPVTPKITRVTYAPFYKIAKNWHIPPNISATTRLIFTTFSALVDVYMGIIKLT